MQSKLFITNNLRSIYRPIFGPFLHKTSTRELLSDGVIPPSEVLFSDGRVSSGTFDAPCKLEFYAQESESETFARFVPQRRTHIVMQQANC